MRKLVYSVWFVIFITFWVCFFYAGRTNAQTPPPPISPGQFVFQMRQPVGPFWQYGVTPIAGKSFGWDGSKVVMYDAGGGGVAVWGNITGTLSAQTDLQVALDAKQSTNATLALGGFSSITGVLPAANVGDLSSTYLTLSAAVASYQPLDGDLTSLASAAGINTIYYRSAASTWSPVSVGAGLSFVGGVLTATNTNIGTVTSVALSMPGIFSVSGSPITSSGAFGVTLSTQLPNVVFAGPVSGVSSSPTFRALVMADIPDISAAYVPVTRTVNGHALSSNVTVTASDVGLGAALTIGAHLTGTSYNGTSGVTIATDAASANTAGTIIARDGSGNFTAGNITAALTGNASTATALQNSRTIGGVSFDGTANITVASATGGFTVSGGNLSLGTNSLALTGSIGATGARAVKGWFTDLEVTNSIVGGVTGNAGTATALQTARTISISGDLVYTSPSFDGSGSVTAVGTLANTAVTPGSYTSANITVDSKGRVTAATNGSGGAGTVSSVSVVTANGVSGSVATATTTPAITLTLGNITPTNVGTTGTRVTKGWFTDLEVTNPIVADLAGNANSATNATSSSHIDVNNDVTTNSTYYPLWTTGASSARLAYVSLTKLTFNPSTGLLTTPGLSSSTVQGSTSVSTSGTLQIAFDGSNYTNVTTSSVGLTSFVATGTTPSFLFSNPVQIQQATLGNSVQTTSSVAGSGDNPSEIIYQGKGTTTNATATTIQTIPLPSNKSSLVEVHIVARRTGGTAGTADDAAGYVIVQTYKNPSGTASAVGTVSLIAQESVTAYVAVLTPSGSNVLVQVTGVLNTNVSWASTAKVWTIGQ